jgi:hypothetical protein
MGFFKSIVGICTSVFNLHSTPLHQINMLDEGTPESVSSDATVVWKYDFLKKVLPAGTYQFASGDSFTVTYSDAKGMLYTHRDITFEYQDTKTRERHKDVLRVFNPLFFTWKKTWSPSLFEVINNQHQVEVHHDRGTETKILLNLGNSKGESDDGQAYFIWYENRWLDKHFSGMIEKRLPSQSHDG